MNIKMIFHTLGKILIVEALLMILPVIVCLYYKEYSQILAFIIPMVSLFLLGGLTQIKKPKRTQIFAKEGFVIVGLSWIFLSMFGALPFVISGLIPNYIDALFETVSGFTTTGSSVIKDIDTMYDLHKGALFWRSFTHWVGGMGVLVFVLAILPNSEGQNIYLMKAESTGVSVGKLVSKIKLTARILYVIYFVMTIIHIIFLFFDPTMPKYDAVLLSFGSAGTGGFGLKGDSIGSYSTYSQVVIAVFMMLFGINFNMFYLILIGKFKQVLKNEELRWYLGIIIVSTIIIALDIFFTVSLAYTNIMTALKDSFFQVSSIITTTGYATVDFAKWSNLSKTVLLLLMFIGGCAGSTGGGMKVQRIVILFKSLKRAVKQVIHPKSVTNVKFEGNKLDEDIVKGVTNYTGFIFVILLLLILLLSFDNSKIYNAAGEVIAQGFTLEDNFTAAVTCINNIGPGLTNIVGPMGNFASYNWFSKLTLIAAMLLGRLEIYPILLIFSPRVWLNK